MKNDNTSKKTIAERGMILKTVAGSHLHGTNHADSDVDCLGVYIEPAECLVGFSPCESVSLRDTVDEKSVSDDVEGTAYGLRKFCHLALGGNPSVTALLYAPEQQVVVSTELGRELRSMWHDFVSYSALKAYSGYMDQQFGRLTGVRGQKRTNRPALVDKFGYDVKYAAHAIRLGYQGLEYARNDGWVQEPLEPMTRSILLNVLSGQVPFDDAVNMTRELRDQLRKVVEDHLSNIPTHPKVDKVEQFLVKSYLDHWAPNAMPICRTTADISST